MRHHCLTLLTALALWGLQGAPAWAQARAGGPEVWALGELRVPWDPTHDSDWWQPQSLRLIHDLRHSESLGAFQHALIRTGPLWSLGPWGHAAVNFSAAIERVGLTQVQSEYRWEGEWGRRFRWQDWGLAQRSRVEWRSFPTEQRLRLREQWRVTRHLEGPLAPFTPFASGELLWESHLQGLSQTRWSVGTSWVVRPDLRLDLGYLYRPRAAGTAWVDDHALMVAWFFAPEVSPLLDDANGGS